MSVNPPAKRSKWLLLIPVGCAGVLVLCCGFFGVIYTLVSGTMRQSEPYRDALGAARDNVEVIEALGEPIEAGFFVTGSINSSGGVGSANLSIPISGPKGSATIYVVAEKYAGTWEYQTMVVDTGADRIDLIDEVFYDDEGDEYDEDPPGVDL